MGQMSGCSPTCVWDPSRAQRGQLHPTPVRGSCALGAASPRVCKGATPTPPERGMWAGSPIWELAETFPKAHTLYGAKTNICSGGGTVAQPGDFTTPPSIIRTVSAANAGPGRQHLALWPGGTGTALAKQGCSSPSAGHPAAAGSERDGDGRCPGGYRSPVPPWVGPRVWPWPLSPPKQPPGCTPRALEAQSAPSALSRVLRLSRAMTDFGAEPRGFGERLLSEHRGLRSVVGGCHTVPGCGVRGTACAAAAGAGGV